MFGFIKNMMGSGNEQLATVIKEGAFLVDVRTPGEFAGGSVKGAVNIPLDKLQSQLSKFKGKTNIVVFCLSGGRSGQAKAFLDKNGIANVINGGPWTNVRQIVNSL
ncbi:MAG TPA: rhodanese-like domain-containing protein [Chitinophagales bacterium]|nr:rhodanese-like domain-containing protein [Chitinophagales bacterium]MCB0514160.1 rhodanese-like domain-containing protein [Bacteroidota bacterium]HMU98738.1 rhodanese-like domain-containing protein [Chitinophagales bacterium]HMV03219.1 rhodanese-like domain-containing protein [Chitinophagales bacterium]HMW94169.1 rhodanese-like domain-containing protein [Chitinophagales bacterium]